MSGIPHCLRRLLRLSPLLLCATGWAQPAGQVSEQDVKAAYVFNFLQFIEWPGGEATAKTELTLCVSAFSPLKRPLTALDGRQGTKARTVRVKLLDPSDIGTCRIVVLDNSDADKVSRAVQTMPDGHGILIIADEATGQSPEVAIALSRQDGRIVFGIDSDAAAKAGLLISSKLQRLAKRTR